MEDTKPVTHEFIPEIVCNACFKTVNETDSFCDNCGYPLKGTEKDQENFVSVRNAKEIDLEEANKKIKRAGNVLYWIAGITIVSGIILYFVNHELPTFIVNMVLGSINVILGTWSKKKPLSAIISGAALYVIVLILNAIINPLSIATGLIMKIFFISYFIVGIKSAIEAEKIKKELNVE
jgi:hypothetical protein